MSENRNSMIDESSGEKKKYFIPDLTSPDYDPNNEYYDLENAMAINGSNVNASFLGDDTEYGNEELGLSAYEDKAFLTMHRDDRGNLELKLPDDWPESNERIIEGNIDVAMKNQRKLRTPIQNREIRRLLNEVARIPINHPILRDAMTDRNFHFRNYAEFQDYASNLGLKVADYNPSPEKFDEFKGTYDDVYEELELIKELNITGAIDPDEFDKCYEYLSKAHEMGATRIDNHIFRFKHNFLKNSPYAHDLAMLAKEHYGDKINEDKGIYIHELNIGMENPNLSRYGRDDFDREIFNPYDLDYMDPNYFPKNPEDSQNVKEIVSKSKNIIGRVKAAGDDISIRNQMALISGNDSVYNDYKHYLDMDIDPNKINDAEVSELAEVLDKDKKMGKDAENKKIKVNSSEDELNNVEQEFNGDGAPFYDHGKKSKAPSFEDASSNAFKSETIMEGSEKENTNPEEKLKNESVAAAQNNSNKQKDGSKKNPEKDNLDSVNESIQKILKEEREKYSNIIQDRDEKHLKELEDLADENKKLKEEINNSQQAQQAQHGQTSMMPTINPFHPLGQLGGAMRTSVGSIAKGSFNAVSALGQFIPGRDKSASGDTNEGENNQNSPSNQSDYSNKIASSINSKTESIAQDIDNLKNGLNKSGDIATPDEVDTNIDSLTQNINDLNDEIDATEQFLDNNSDLSPEENEKIKDILEDAKSAVEEKTEGFDPEELGGNDENKKNKLKDSFKAFSEKIKKLLDKIFGRNKEKSNDNSPTM